MAKMKEKKTNAMRILDSAKADYNVYTYECEEFVDGVACTKKLGMPLEQSFKTLVTRGKSGEYYVFVIPVAEEVDFKKAARAVSEKAVEMVPVKEIQQLTGYIRGGVSPIGMKRLYRTIIDERAQQFERILVSGGKIGCSIRLKPEDLKRVTKGDYAQIAV